MPRGCSPQVSGSGEPCTYHRRARSERQAREVTFVQVIERRQNGFVQPPQSRPLKMPVSPHAQFRVSTTPGHAEVVADLTTRRERNARHRRRVTVRPLPHQRDRHAALGGIPLPGARSPLLVVGSDLGACAVSAWLTESPQSDRLARNGFTRTLRSQRQRPQRRSSSQLADIAGRVSMSAKGRTTRRGCLIECRGTPEHETVRCQIAAAHLAHAVAAMTRNRRDRPSPAHGHDPSALHQTLESRNARRSRVRVAINRG